MLRRMRPDEYEGVYEIMNEAFPVDEKRTFDEEKELLSNPSFEILVWQDAKSEKIKGFITSYRMNGFRFIEHFAVGAKYRNEGIGKAVLSELCKADERLCLEVEPPVTEQAVRRIEFYRRNGFSLNPYPYVQPPISKGTNAVPLMIMTTGGEVDETEFTRIRRALYLDVYRVRADETFL